MTDLPQVTDAPEPGEPDGATEAPAPEPAQEDKLVPVAESIRYRKRAQAAEQRLGEMEAELEAALAELDQAREAIDAVERRSRIDQLLIEADAIDLEAARLLAAAAVESMDDPDVAVAVEELRQRKPYLFRRQTRGPSSMGPRLTGTRSSLDDAADTAASTGDRRDLLRYLRLRRSAAG